MAKNKYGVIVGRMSPLHLGHRGLIQKMLDECGYENSLLLIGSCNAEQSMRHFFDYEQRRGFIKKIFPEIRVMGLPDFPNSNQCWLLQLDDTLRNCGFDPLKTKFYTGNEEDIEVLVGDARDFTSLDRFDKNKPIISAQQVRSVLVHQKDPKFDLMKLVGVDLADDILVAFKKNWQQFESK